METLDQIGVRRGTDSSSLFHDYFRVVEPYFAPYRERGFNFLEIGVLGGNSMFTWIDYFPNAHVVGVDINPIVISHKRARKIIGDASKPDVWTIVGKHWPYSIIWDDAAHTTHSIVAAFGFAWPLLAKGGLYVVTDLHAPFLTEFRRDNALSNFPGDWTPIDFFADASKTRLHENGANQCGRPTTGDFEYVHFYKSLCIIKKR